MPGCGITSEFLYDRLKAAADAGSETASQLMQNFVFPTGGETFEDVVGQDQQLQQGPGAEPRAAADAGDK